LGQPTLDSALGESLSHRLGGTDARMRRKWRWERLPGAWRPTRKLIADKELGRAAASAAASMRDALAAIARNICRHRIPSQAGPMTDSRFTSPGAAVVLALALGACAADAPTAATPAVPGAPSETRAVVSDGPMSQLLEDARGRLVPSLAEATMRGRLQDRLQALAAALDDGEDSRVRRQLALTRKQVSVSARTLDDADLAALTLALDQIQSRIDASAEPAQP
jgi:hypothetical protein